MNGTIKALRKARGWRQEDLAEKTGLSVSIISAYEKGTRSFTYKTLAPIAKALGVDVADLISREGLTLETYELLEVLLERVPREFEDQDTKGRWEHYVQLMKGDLEGLKSKTTKEPID